MTTNQHFVLPSKHQGTETYSGYMHKQLNKMGNGAKFTIGDLIKAIHSNFSIAPQSKSASAYIYKMVANGAIKRIGSGPCTTGIPAAIYQVADTSKLRSIERWWFGIDSRQNTKKVTTLNPPAAPAQSFKWTNKQAADTLLQLAAHFENQADLTQKKPKLKDFTTAELMSELKRRMK